MKKFGAAAACVVVVAVLLFLVARNCEPAKHELPKSVRLGTGGVVANQDPASLPAVSETGDLSSEHSGERRPSSERASVHDSITIRAIDAKTRQGIPWLEVELSSIVDGVEQKNSSVTEEDGRATLKQHSGSTRTRVTFRDDHVGYSTARSLALDDQGLAAATEIPIEIGPTYVLRLTADAPRVEGLHARLLVASQPDGKDAQWLPLRSGVSPWMRFPFSTRGASGRDGSAPMILLGDESGTRIGRAKVPDTTGVFLEPLDVTSWTRARSPGQ